MNFNGMWLSVSEDPREALQPGKGEKAVLVEYLDRYRMTFELKCEGLTAEQLASRSVPPSTMSLLGLIRHLARVEHHWARRMLEGQHELSRLYRTSKDPDLDFDQARAEDSVVVDDPVEVHGKRSTRGTSVTQTCCASASTAALASKHRHMSR